MKKQFSDVTLFHTPMYGLPMEEYKLAGYIDSYIQDEQREIPENQIVMLFRAEEQYAEKLDDIITMLGEYVKDSYGYDQKLVALVLSIPEEFLEDHQTILAGEYSKLSDLYRDQVQGKIYARAETSTQRTITLEKRLQLMIMDKEKRVSLMTGLKEPEVWPKFDIQENTLTLTLVEQLTK